MNKRQRTGMLPLFVIALVLIFSGCTEYVDPGNGVINIKLANELYTIDADYYVLKARNLDDGSGFYLGQSWDSINKKNWESGGMLLNVGTYDIRVYALSQYASENENLEGSSKVLREWSETLLLQRDDIEVLDVDLGGSTVSIEGDSPDVQLDFSDYGDLNNAKYFTYSGDNYYGDEISGNFEDTELVSNKYTIASVEAGRWDFQIHAFDDVPIFDVTYPQKIKTWIIFEEKIYGDSAIVISLQ